MKTVEQTRRELFENEYVQYRQYLKRNKDGSYNEEWVDARWQGFSAALDAVEIELPREVEMKSSQEFDHGIEAGYSSALEDVRAAIESTNLGLKIR